jgi:hypothetical protein
LERRVEYRLFLSALLERICLKYDLYRHINIRGLSLQGNEGWRDTKLSPFLLKKNQEVVTEFINNEEKVLWSFLRSYVFCSHTVNLPYRVHLSQIRCLRKGAEIWEDEENVLWILLTH